MKTNFLDASKDITDIDIVRQNYYRLMAEQAAWNLRDRKTDWSYPKQVLGYLGFIAVVGMIIWAAACK